MPAQATAKSVMASAKRLIELRHDWRSNSRKAEIRVPAWPIPIHHTKLTMANPQPTGMLMPQMPNALVEEIANRQQEPLHESGKQIAKPTSQPLRDRPAEDDGADFVGDAGEGVPRRNDRRFLFAEFDFGWCIALPCSAQLLTLTLPSPGWDFALRQIGGARPRIQIIQQSVIPRLCFQLATPGCSDH